MERQKLIAGFFTILIAGFLTGIGIYGFGEYGYSLFVITPLFIGFCSVFVLGNKFELTLWESIKFGQLILFISLAIMLVAALEGAICVFMVMPIAIILTLVGSVLAYNVNKSKWEKKNITIWILLLSIPTTSFFESKTEPELLIVTTIIEINADIKTVWNNVIEFPKLKPPTEFLFKNGISYPISAKIEGKGVGAIRYCNFSTGSFKEPITTWDEPSLLQFDVDESPKPMTELSYTEIDAPHLHNYFVSKKGEFRLIKISENKTKLIGTTWYINNIRPVFYWRLWSDFIIHKIHERVLNHIKVNAEKSSNSKSSRKSISNYPIR